jgi:hypothetical protein
MICEAFVGGGRHGYMTLRAKKGFQCLASEPHRFSATGISRPSRAATLTHRVESKVGEVSSQIIGSLYERHNDHDTSHFPNDLLLDYHPTFTIPCA